MAKAKKTKRTKRRGSRSDRTPAARERNDKHERAAQLRALVLDAHLQASAAVASLTESVTKMRELCRSIGMQHIAADDAEYALMRARISQRSLEELMHAVGIVALKYDASRAAGCTSATYDARGVRAETSEVPS